MARPRIHDEALKQRLLQTASEHIAAGGAAALSLRALAEAAGTTTAAVYSLFGDREGLVAAVVDEGFRGFGEVLHAVERTEDPWADLLALGIAYRDYALGRPHFYRVMFDRPTGGSDRDTAAAPTFAVLREAAGRASGTDAQQAEGLATRLWALAHGLVSLELNGLLPAPSSDGRRAYIDALQAAV